MTLFNGNGEQIKFAKKHDSTIDEQWPYGGQDGSTGTLVVCISDLQRTYVAKGFELKAHYILPGAAITERQYNKIIIFTPQFESGREMMRYKQWIEERVLPRLKPQGEVYYV